MSGWTRRRSSGEIINATLLEVFLALVFVVFALAVFEQRRAQAAEARLANVLTTTERDSLLTMLDAIRDSLLRAQSIAAGRADSLMAADSAIAKLRFDSPYPPDCEPRAQPPWLLTITLAGPNRLDVEAHRPVEGAVVGQTITVSTSEFRARFESVRRVSQQRGCRFYVRIQDTPDMPKSDYKAAMSAITSICQRRFGFAHFHRRELHT